MRTDFHLHSNHSDGTDSPAELVLLAKANNVSCISLTDHDTISGFNELESAATEAGISTIPGVEISTSANGIRIHILGYFIDPKSDPLNEFLHKMGRLRTDATRPTLEKLNQLNLLAYSWDRVNTFAGSKTWVNGSTVFSAMMHDGYYSTWAQFKSFKDVFFSKKSPGYQTIDSVNAFDAIDIIKKAGGVPVLAHPALIGDDLYIQPLVEHGLEGIEVYYPAHTPADTLRYRKIARAHKLFITGGTDWHGDLTTSGARIGDCSISKAEYHATLPTPLKTFDKRVPH